MNENVLSRYGYTGPVNALANARFGPSGWDRDSVLPFARRVEDGDVVRGGGIMGSDWHLAAPQFAADALQAAVNVGSSNPLGPYYRGAENREAMTETAGAVVGPMAGAGMARNALAGRGGSELGSFGGRLAERGNIGHNGGPQMPHEITYNGKTATVTPNRVSLRYSDNADLNEFLLQARGDIDAVIRETASEPNYRKIHDDAVRWKESGGENVERPGVVPDGWRGGWYHGTDADGITQMRPSEDGFLGPGVYAARSGEYAKKHGKHLYEIQHRGELMPETEYMSLADHVGNQLGLEAGSNEVKRLLAPIMREYGYTGVKYGSGRDLMAAILDPADTQTRQIYGQGVGPQPVTPSDQYDSTLAGILARYGLTNGGIR
jgi:hypothetical protein